MHFIDVHFICITFVLRKIKEHRSDLPIICAILRNPVYLPLKHHTPKRTFLTSSAAFIEKNCGSAHDSITEGARARDRGRESSSFTAPSGNFPN